MLIWISLTIIENKSFLPRKPIAPDLTLAVYNNVHTSINIHQLCYSREEIHQVDCPTIKNQSDVSILISISLSRRHNMPRCQVLLSLTVNKQNRVRLTDRRINRFPIKPHEYFIACEAPPLLSHFLPLAVDRPAW